MVRLQRRSGSLYKERPSVQARKPSTREDTRHRLPLSSVRPSASPSPLRPLTACFSVVRGTSFLLGRQRHRLWRAGQLCLRGSVIGRSQPPNNCLVCVAQSITVHDRAASGGLRSPPEAARS